MSGRSDVLVIGGGIVGVCSAHYLAARGKSVTLLERGEIASGCSAGNAGFVCPSHSVPLAAPGVIKKGLKWMFDPDSPFYIKPRFSPALFSWLWKFRAACTEERVRRVMTLLRDLHCESLELFDKLAKAGQSFGWRRDGLLSLFRTDHALQEGLKESALLQEIGIPSRAFTPDEIAAKVPRARPGLAGGILFPGDAHLDPLAFVRGLATHVQSRGVQVRTGVEVLGFATSGRKITAVRTAQGEFAADQVVLATGSWTPTLARELNLGIPIQPAKGYSITMTRPEGSPSVPLLLAEAKVGVTPLPGDRLRLAGTLELAGLDLTINERRVEAIRRGANTFLDGLDSVGPGEVWRGLRPCTPDGLPVLGRSAAIENLILAAGHAMIGLSLGPVTGSLVARIACGEPIELDLAPLHPERF